MRRFREYEIVFSASLLALAVSQPAWCGDGSAEEMHIPRQELAASLLAVGKATNTEILFRPQDLRAAQASPLDGSFSAQEAVRQLVKGTGLTVEAKGGSIFIRGRALAEGDQAPPSDNQITVTGTRIIGAPIASAVITINREIMQERGFNDLGAVVRDLPQSFGGGQNPGVGYNVPGSRGADVGGGSSVNLRGLGSDATLTLLDGHRVAYTASRQSVDVSAIPIGIVDHIDVVPDGASALYGSDAVAGVANVVLRKDMKGVETTSRVGGSTDGGNFQQQYGFAAGDRWKSGGFIFAYDYGSSDPIWGRQRSYAKAVAPNLMLMPALWHHSGAFNGHQSLTDNLTLETNAYFNLRREDSFFPLLSGGVLGTGQLRTRDQVWGIAPTLKLRLGPDWHANLSGTVGKEHVDLYNGFCGTSACAQTSLGYYRNLAHSVELNGDGKLLDLPAGPLRLAVGAGYRAISFTNYGGVGSALNTQHSQDSSYAYGELALPLVGPAQAIPFIKSLNLSGAVRYERYPGIASVATPKFGLIYAPTSDLDIKASWGQSFRAPTLYEQYQPRSVYLFNASSLGATGYPATASALYVQGGSPNLKPERANTWSAGITFHPRAVPGAKLEVSYYNIHYRDRIVSPITVYTQALGNPIYQSQITASPDAAAQAAFIGAASNFLNVSSYPYATSNVVALVNNATVNAGHQWVQGVDILAEYDADVSTRDHMKLSVDAVYIESQQQLSASQPILPLAGTIFNPPHWRGQANLTWKHDAATLNLAGHYTGGVTDNRSTTIYQLGSMATMDVTARYALHDVFGPLRGVTLTFSVQNLFNAKPTQITTSARTDAPYDSTNYSPYGRVLSFGVNTKW